MAPSIAMYRQQSNQTSVISIHKVKWSNNSTSHQSFVYIQLKCQTVLFDPRIGTYLVQFLQATVDLGVMTLKGYSALSKALALLEPHYQIV